MANRISRTLRRHPALTALTALLAGIPGLYAWWFLVAVAHNHGVVDPWLAAFLPQVMVGLLLGAVHRWAYVPLAAGMILWLLAMFASQGGPLAPYVLATGWPLIPAGLAASMCTRVLERRIAI